MGYEKRSGRYYRFAKKRVEGRPVSTYFGRTEVTDECASLEKRRIKNQRTGCRAGRLKREHLERELARLRAEGDLIRETANLLMRATLVAGGYKKHRGEWRSVRRGRPRLAAPLIRNQERTEMDEERGRRDLERLMESPASAEERSAFEADRSRLADDMASVDAGNPTPADRERAQRALLGARLLESRTGRLALHHASELLKLLDVDDTALRLDLRQGFLEHMLVHGWPEAEGWKRTEIQVASVEFLEMEVHRLLSVRSMSRPSERHGYHVRDHALQSSSQRYGRSSSRLKQDRARKDRGRRPGASGKET